jgi:uncharacterized protein YegL
MKLKEKQELAKKLSNLHNYTLEEIVNLVNTGKAPKYLLTDTRKVSITGIKKFVDKYSFNKNITAKVEPTVVNNYNEYVLLIDNSGSTNSIAKQIENGVNSFVTNLAKQDKDAMVNLVKFSSGNYTQTRLTNVNNIYSYHHNACGSTPLTKTIYDFLQKGNINTTIVVFTDGECDEGRHGSNRIKDLVSNYKGTIVFIGTGEHYAKKAGIKDGNILTFEASISGTIKAYQELVEASVEHTKGIKEGKDMSKEDFFKTKTELATMLKKSANIDMTVCYEKKMSKEQKESNIKEAKEYFDNISRQRLYRISDIDYNKLFNIMNKVEERVLFGKHDGTINEFGRYKFIEYNSKTPKNPHREVNPDTILWIEVKGKRYNKK